MLKIPSKEYVLSISKKDPDDLLKRGLAELSPSLIASIKSCESNYLLGFAVGHGMSNNLLCKLFLTDFLKRNPPEEISERDANAALVSAVMAALEYVACTTLVERGFLSDPEAAVDATILH